MKKLGLPFLGLLAFLGYILGDKKPAPSTRPLPVVTSPAPVAVPPSPPIADVPPVVEVAPVPQSEVREYVTGSRVPLRSAPDAKAAIIDRMNAGLPVIIVEKRGQWVRVRHSMTQQEGWMSSRRLSADMPTPRKYDKPKDIKPKLTEAAIVALLIERSVASYRETRPCACPYNSDRAGRSCGSRSAWSRPGGAKPLCYAGDVTRAMVAEYIQE